MYSFQSPENATGLIFMINQSNAEYGIIINKLDPLQHWTISNEIVISKNLSFFACMEAAEQPIQEFPVLTNHILKIAAYFAKPEQY